VAAVTLHGGQRREATLRAAVHAVVHPHDVQRPAHVPRFQYTACDAEPTLWLLLWLPSRSMDGSEEKPPCTQCMH
jgi:hypothetical protein